MRIFFHSLLAIMALPWHGALAQSSTAYTDPNTGIIFQSTTTNGVKVGIAVPEDIKTDLIAQITAPITTKGWAGITLTGSMRQSLLVVAYPNSKKEIVASLRTADDWTQPTMYNGSATLRPIPKGNFVDDKSMTYTFLCSGCIGNLTFAPTNPNPVLGFAYSTQPVANPDTADSTLEFHNKFGAFGLNLEAAKSPKFAEWAAMAIDSPANPGTPGGGNDNGGPPSPPPTLPISNITYDYIIAGGGPAGIIAATRLAERNVSVLLVERGGASYYAAGGRTAIMPWNKTVTAFDVPGLSFQLSKIDGTSSAYCSDTAGMAGCILGGGSTINALNWVRPAAHDFDDRWPEGWKWQDVKDAAARVYAKNPGTVAPSMDGKYYDQMAYDVLSRHFQSNGWHVGNSVARPNDKHMVFGHPGQNVQNGLRAGPVMTYLPSAQKMRNFKLQLDTKVVRAVRTGSKITGVEIETAAGRQIVRLNEGGKVILAAGTMSTPRILFNSGIGPKEQINIVKTGTTSVTLPLESAWVDLPVGEIILDHPVWKTKWNVHSNGSSLANNSAAEFPTLLPADFLNPSQAMTDQFARGIGPLVQSGQRFEFFTHVINRDGSKRYIQGSCSSQESGTVQIKVYLTHGLTSKGKLGIKSNGATEFVVEPWMNTAGDKEAVESIMNTLLAYSRKPGSTLTYAGASGREATGKDIMTETKRDSGSHFVGTTRMGRDDGRNANGTAVVDLNAKVYGTDNLFVVDASIHPDLPTGNTQAIVYVVAEKAVEKILAISGHALNGTAHSQIHRQGLRGSDRVKKGLVDPLQLRHKLSLSRRISS